MRQYRSFLRDHYNLRYRGIEIGTEVETGKQIFADLKLLPKGLHVLGPPGSGKSKMLLNFFGLFSRLSFSPTRVAFLSCLIYSPVHADSKLDPFGNRTFDDAVPIRNRYPSWTATRMGENNIPD